MADNEDQSAVMAENGGANGTIPEDDRKLFIGGLSWETNEAQIKEYFAQFGEIDSVNLKTDSNTGKSRGFAFVLFKTVESLDQAINAGEHTINNKKIDAKKAKAKQGKIFVGGLTPEISDDDIRNHFAQFGNIVQVELPFDKIKNQRKAFCFITYETEAVISDVLRNAKQTISGKEVDVKKAAPKPADANKGWGGGGGGFQGAPRRGGRPPRGGGGGGGRNNYQNQNWNNYNQGGYGGYNQTYGGYDAYANYGGNGGGGGGGYNNYQSFGGGGGYGGGYQNQGNQRNGGGGGRGRQQQRHQPY